MFSVRYSRRALKALRKAKRDSAKANLAKIDALAINPFAAGLDVKKLQGREGYRLRVGEWRVLYDLDTELKVLSVEDVADRKEAYR